MLILAADAAATSSISDTLMGGLLALGGVVVTALFGLLTTFVSGRKDFDQKMRLDKEYGLYGDLWEKLFEFRKAVGELVDPLFMVPSEEMENVESRLRKSFNTFQLAVKHSEPFIHLSVSEPAYDILKTARRIVSNDRKIRVIDEHREKAALYGGTHENDMAQADKQIALDDQNQDLLSEIEAIAERVSTAIHKRVGPS